MFNWSVNDCVNGGQGWELGGGGGLDESYRSTYLVRLQELDGVKKKWGGIETDTI